MSDARLGILLSGSGSTYANLADQQLAGAVPGTIACVIASRPHVDGLTRAAERTHPHAVAHDPEQVSAILADHGATHVAMCGWMRFWDPPPPWHHRTVNIHPSLLPAFGGRGMYGMHVHRAVLNAGCRITGCTAHLVGGDYDSGPILAQQAVPVLSSDSPEQLAARVQAAERQLYPKVVSALINDQIKRHDQRWTITGDPQWRYGDLTHGDLE